MAESVGQVALDIVMGKNTVTDVVKTAMSDCQNVISNSSASMSTKIGTVGTAVTKVGSAMLPMSTAVAGVGVACGKSALDFENSMAKLTTIAGKSSTEYNGKMQSMSKAVMQLSDDTGIAASECSEATYQAISAGVDVSKSVSFVANANKLAKGGFTDLTTATDTLTTAINAYGLKADDATNISDKLITVQNLGKTSVGELGASLGKIIPTAAAYGVNLDNLGAAYVKTTAGGISTAESTTYLNSMINELGKSGTGVSNILKEKTGKSFADLMKDGNSLGDVMQILQQYCDETGTQFGDLWSSAEAGKAAMVLAKDGAEGFNETLGKVGDSAGTTDKAFDEMKTTSYTMEKAMNQIKNASIELGQTLMTVLGPMIESVCGKVEAFTNWFGNLGEGWKKAIVIVGLVVAALGPLLIGIGKVITIVGSAVKAFGTISTAVKAFSALITGNVIPALGSAFAFIAANPIVLVIGAIIAAGVLLIANWDKVKAAAKALGSFISTTWGDMKTAVSTKASEIKQVATTKFNELKNSASTIWGNIKTGTSTEWGHIKTAVVKKAGEIKTEVSNKFSALKDSMSKTWGNIKTTSSTLWSSIKDVISSKAAQAKAKVSDYAGKIKDVMKFSGLKGIVSNTFNAVKSAITKPVEKALSVVKSVVGKLKSAFNFSWHLPHLSVPHISVSGGKAPFGIGGKGSLPHFNVKWYAKAMDNPVLMNRPTAFGTDANGNVLAGGEAGQEVVSGASKLMSMIETAVGKALNAPALKNASKSSVNSDATAELLKKIIELLKDRSSGDGTPVQFFLDGRMIDEYLINRDNNRVLRSGGVS